VLLHTVHPKNLGLSSVLGYALSEASEGARYHVYLDARANHPYYIYRVAGVELVKAWRKTARATLARVRSYRFVLQGFFAGEGNIKYDKASHSRTVRISQGKRYRPLERVLRHYGITFRYGEHRMYSISGKENLERLSSIGITRLHRLKHERFLRMMASYKQTHYKRGAATGMALEWLNKPLTAVRLACLVHRSTRRASMILSELREAGLVRKFRVRSTYYWIRTDVHTVVISPEKSRILNQLRTPKRQVEIAEAISRSTRSVSKRLGELLRLGLVVRKSSKWYRLDTPLQVIVRFR